MVRTVRSQPGAHSETVSESKVSETELGLKLDATLDGKDGHRGGEHRDQAHTSQLFHVSAPEDLARVF